MRISASMLEFVDIPSWVPCLLWMLLVLVPIPSQWIQSLDAFPWVPIRCLWISDCIPMSPYSMPVNLLMLEFKFLFPCQWISGCIPMSSYFPANGMNLWTHSHEFLFPANESQTAFPWVTIRGQWISDCIPWVPISLPNFWSLLVGYHPYPTPPTSGMPIGFPQLRPERDFGCTPYHHTWVPLKSRRERFRGFYAIFIFGLIFWFSESENRIPIMWKSWHSTRERVSKKTRRLDSTIQSPLWSSRNGSGMTK